MKIRTVIFILGLAGIVVSCIPSLYPLYRQKDLLMDARLEGLYETDEEDYWKISRLDPGLDKLYGDWRPYNTGYTYRLSVMEDGEMEEFALHLLRLGGDLYLDFFPVGYDIRHGFLQMHLVPTHIFAKVELTKQAMIIHFFDIEWLEDLIEEKRIKISHVELPDRYLLSARTEELQKFITKFANDSTTFVEPDTLWRQNISAGIRDLALEFNPD